MRTVNHTSVRTVRTVESCALRGCDTIANTLRWQVAAVFFLTRLSTPGALRSVAPKIPTRAAHRTHTLIDTLYRQRRTASRHPIRRATMLHEHVRARSSPSLHDCRFCSTGRRDILQGPLRRAPPKPSHADLCAHRRRRRACSSTVGAVLADPALSGCAAALVRSMARLRAERASRMRSPTPIKIPAAPTSCSPGPDTPHTMRAWHTRQS